MFDTVGMVTANGKNGRCEGGSIDDGDREAGERNQVGWLSGGEAKGGMFPGKKYQARTVCGGKGLKGIVKLLKEVGGLCTERAVHALRRFMLTEATGEAAPKLVEAYHGSCEGARRALKEGP